MLSLDEKNNDTGKRRIAIKIKQPEMSFFLLVGMVGWCHPNLFEYTNLCAKLPRPGESEVAYGFPSQLDFSKVAIPVNVLTSVF